MKSRVSFASNRAGSALLAGLFLASISIASLVQPARAQSDNLRELRHAAAPTTWIGLRGGINLANESIDNTLDGASTGSRALWHGGLQVDQWIGSSLAISTGLLMNQKGTHEEYAPNSKAHPNYSGSDDFTFTYLEVPLLLRFAFGDGDRRPYLFVGPSFGFLMSASEATTNNVMPVLGLKDSLNSTNISIFFGAGFMDKVSDRSMLFIDAGYAAGISKVYKMPPSTGDPPKNTFYRIDNAAATAADIRVAVGYVYGL